MPGACQCALGLGPCQRAGHDMSMSFLGPPLATSVLWAECCLPPNVCPPGASECDLTWKEGLCREHHGKDRNEITLDRGCRIQQECPHKRQKRTRTGAAHVKTEAEAGGMECQGSGMAVSV